MRTGSRRGLRERVRAWRRRRGPRGVILLYHRVTELDMDPQLLCVSPSRFEAHLQVLESYRPTRLSDLARCATDGADLSGRVAVTFDDGYADNGSTARPLLESHDIPATVFVSTGYVENGREYWWDELERLLLRPRELPGELTLELSGELRCWPLGSAGAPGADMAGWSVLSAETPSPRHAVYRELHQLLKPMHGAERSVVLDRLARSVGDPGATRSTHRAMTVAELKGLAGSPKVTLGAHTATHPQLSALPAEEQRGEIETSRRTLEAWTGAPVESFSYPYGARTDFGPVAVEGVRSAGFECACANSPHAVEAGCDPFRLPRFLVRDWGKDEFARRLTSMFEA